MPHMPNAPLIYTIAVVGFSRVPEIERFTDKFFDTIRAEYPYDEKFEQAQISAQVGPNGLTVKQELKPVWQYLSPNRDCGFLLTHDAIYFHTNNYQSSVPFLDRFKLGLSRLKATPDIGIQYTTLLGIRYLDLVVPPGTIKLADFVEDWVLPKESPNDGLQIEEGAYMARYKTSMGRLNFQAMRNPEHLFPPDLQSPFLQKNGWMKERPKTGDFAIIDTDHMMECTDPNNKFDPDEIIRNLDKLHTTTKLVFESFGTDKAKTFWSSET